MRNYLYILDPLSTRYMKCVAYIVMGAHRGGGKRGHLPPPGIWKRTSYVAVQQSTLKFSLAPSALATDTLYFSLKRRKKKKTQEVSTFCTARRKRVDFLKRRWFCPPLENFLRAPMNITWILKLSCAYDYCHGPILSDPVFTRISRHFLQSTP